MFRIFGICLSWFLKILLAYLLLVNSFHVACIRLCGLYLNNLFLYCKSWFNFMKFSARCPRPVQKDNYPRCKPQLSNVLAGVYIPNNEVQTICQPSLFEIETPSQPQTYRYWNPVQAVNEPGLLTWTVGFHKIRTHCPVSKPHPSIEPAGVETPSNCEWAGVNNPHSGF